MDVTVSATVKQWAHILINTREILALDGRTRKAKKLLAQRLFLVATATDEELKQMAALSADMFSFPMEQVLADLKADRDRARRTKKSWVKYLSKTANKYAD